MQKTKTKTDENPAFVDTPAGIFTVSGFWFHTTPEALKKYAPELFQKKTVAELISDAESWIRASDGLTLLVFFPLLLMISKPAAAITALLFFPLWYINKSAFCYPGVTKIMKLLEKEVAVVLIGVAGLSVLGIQELYAELVLGFLIFFLLKFGLYRKLIDKLYHSRNKKSITLNDRLLRMLVLRYAQAEGVPVAEVYKMEQDFLKLIQEKQEAINKKK